MIKNILIIHPALVVGGADTILINYLTILAKHSDKYNVELVLLEDRQNHRIESIPKEIKISHLLNGIESEFFIFCALRLNEPNRDYFNSWYIGIQEKINRLLLEKINSNAYDLIIDFHSNDSSFEYFLNKFDVHLPIIRWIHADFYLERWKANPDYSAYVLNKYHTFVTIADQMTQKLETILAELNVKNKTITRLYNPVSHEYINQRLTEPVSEADQHLLAQNFILQCSRLDPVKNVAKLVEMFYEIKQQSAVENLKFYIIGQGGEENAIRENIAKYGLENDCILLGKRVNPFPFMKRAKLFVHASLMEGLPTVLIESMMCGTPVVAYDCLTGPKDILDNGKYGELIPLNDEKMFIQKTVALLNDEEKRQHYVDLLPEAVARFSFSQIEKQLLHLLEQTINGKE